jgi:Tol biopolymer transport system component
MNHRDPLERELASWMAEGAVAGDTAGEVDRILATTGRKRPLPRWLALMKEPPMRNHSSVVVGAPTFRLVSLMVVTAALIAALTAATIAAGTSLLPGRPLAPLFGVARNGPIAYGSGGDIYLMEVDDTDGRVFVGGATNDSAPEFSRDGSRLFFIRQTRSGDQLMVMDAEGGEPHVVLDPAPAWYEELPGEDAIIVAQGSPPVLNVVDLATGEVRRPLDLRGPIPLEDGFQLRPPDGRELIVLAHPVAESDELALYGVDLATGEVRRIGEPTTGESPRDAEPRSESAAAGIQWSFQGLSFAPDGRTVAYWNWEPLFTGQPSNAYSHGRDLDTGAEVPLTFLGNDRATMVTYSPDGESVAFRREEPTQQIRYSNLAGGQSKSVGDPFSYLDSDGFAFSPDGRKIVHATTRPWESTIFDLDGGATGAIQATTELPSWRRLAS